MTRVVTLIIAVAVLAATAFLLVRPQAVTGSSPGSAPLPGVSKPTASGTLPEKAEETRRAAGPSPPADASGEVDRILPAAQDGESNAQFRLYELLAGCRDEYASYYGKGSRLLDSTEAAIRADALRSMDEYAVDVYETCHRLIEEQPTLIAQADQWFSKSLAQKHPRAQAIRAISLLQPPGANLEGRTLLSEAVSSGDAYALWMLGEVRPTLGGSAEDTNKERWAMQLASCDRGFDCQPEAKWVKRYCKADPASLCPINANAEEMIRSKTGSDFEMIKMRAKEINALIDAGRGTELVPPQP